MPLFKGIFNPFAKSDPLPALDGGAQGEPKSDGRIVVRIGRRSTRTLDPDNLGASVKALVDCLRYAKLIPEDDEETIDLRVTQEKVKSSKECGTFIEIIYM